MVNGDFTIYVSQILSFANVVGGFEVNFMDDVGQTLLNWASAFGTLEMVGHCAAALELYGTNTKIAAILVTGN